MAIAPASGIRNRLAKPLIYLGNTYPDEAWGQFLTRWLPRGRLPDDARAAAPARRPV